VVIDFAETQEPPPDKHEDMRIGAASLYRTLPRQWASDDTFSTLQQRDRFV
jgi:hypothetical protein